MKKIDPNLLQLVQSPHLESSPSPERKRPRRFLKGPVPLAWLQIASKASGKALHVGVALWYLSGLNRSKTVRLTRSVLQPFGVLRDSARRGLTQLENAGLVSAERRAGRSPRVTILDFPKEPDAGVPAVERDLD